MSAWKITGWICVGIVVLSVAACVLMAGFRSEGLTSVTVTALEAESEPRDHNLPLVKQNEALPDYEVLVLRNDGRQVRLGAKPDMSAVEGISWSLSEPVSLTEIASIRLQEQDKVISDVIAEVQITGDSVTENDYRFDFATERSVALGIASFFGTPIGKAIASGFTIAIILVVVSVLRV